MTISPLTVLLMIVLLIALFDCFTLRAEKRRQQPKRRKARTCGSHGSE